MLSNREQLLFIHLAEIVQKMKSPVHVKQIALESVGFSSLSRVPWRDLSLSGGYPGLLLFFATLEALGLVGEDIAHQYVLAIHQSLQKEPLSDLSLFSGVSGICFALRQASHAGTRYQQMQQKLDNILLEHIEPVYLIPLQEHRRRQESAPSALQDLIQGLPGIGRYLLEDVSLFGSTVESILKELVELSKPIVRQGKEVPGWHLSAHDYLNRHSKWPKGNCNLGLAHGVPGVLAFLSIAAVKGVVVEGQKDAMMRIAHWIQKQAIRSKEEIRWHAMVDCEGENTDSLARDAWCYGVPGVARSLFLCGKALNNKDLTCFALGAFRGIFARTREEWHLPGPMLCHGIAGLLLMTQAMASDTEDADLKAQADKLREYLLADYQSDAPFGYRDLHLDTNAVWQPVDSPGLLEGTAGVLLTLLVSKTSWHLPFLVNA